MGSPGGQGGKGGEFFTFFLFLLQFLDHLLVDRKRLLDSADEEDDEKRGQRKGNPHALQMHAHPLGVQTAPQTMADGSKKIVRNISGDGTRNDKKHCVTGYGQDCQPPCPSARHQNRGQSDMDQIQKGEGIHRAATVMQQQGQMKDIPDHDQPEQPQGDPLPDPDKILEIQIAQGLEDNENEKQG